MGPRARQPLRTAVGSNRAFTLVELLVVIAIIGVLVSLLLPSLAGAREQAKQLKCLANLKDMAAAGTAYSQDDPSGWLIPLHPRYTEASNFDDDANRRGKYVSAARHSFGGKSGSHDFEEDLGAGGGGLWSGEIVGRYSTRNHMGPATRPLNRYIYRDNIQDRYGLTEDETRKDEQLSFETFRCPSDTGFREVPGSRGVYLGFGTHYNERVSYFDNIGSSYAADSLIFTGGPDPGVTGIGAFLRPYPQFGDPSRLTVFKETNGFYAGGWNGLFDLPSREEFALGNHGVMRQHVTGFGDGHAEPILYDVLTDVTIQLNQVFHSGVFSQRGSTVEFHPINPPGLFEFNDIGHFLYTGPGWKDHAFPAPWVHMYDELM
jgi:prepilin-type N-terminal cleavage/methylation domain-containing protein